MVKYYCWGITTLITFTHVAGSGPALKNSKTVTTGTPPIIRCPEGFLPEANRCVRQITQPLVPTCSEGILQKDNVCLLIAPPHRGCPRDFVLVKGVCIRSATAPAALSCPPGFVFEPGHKKAASLCTRAAAGTPFLSCPHGSIPNPSNDGCISETIILPTVFCPDKSVLMGQSCIKTELYDCAPSFIGAKSKKRNLGIDDAASESEEENDLENPADQRSLGGVPKHLKKRTEDPIHVAVVNQQCEKRLVLPPIFQCPLNSVLIGRECVNTVVTPMAMGVPTVNIETAPPIATCPDTFSPCGSFRIPKKHAQECCSAEEAPFTLGCALGFHLNGDLCQSTRPAELVCATPGFSKHKHKAECLRTQYVEPIITYTTQVTCVGLDLVGIPSNRILKQAYRGSETTLSGSKSFKRSSRLKPESLVAFPSLTRTKDGIDQAEDVRGKNLLESAIVSFCFPAGTTAVTLCDHHETASAKPDIIHFTLNKSSLLGYEVAVDEKLWCTALRIQETVSCESELLDLLDLESVLKSTDAEISNANEESLKEVDAAILNLSDEHERVEASRNVIWKTLYAYVLVSSWPMFHWAQDFLRLFDKSCQSAVALNSPLSNYNKHNSLSWAKRIMAAFDFPLLTQRLKTLSNAENCRFTRLKSYLCYLMGWTPPVVPLSMTLFSRLIVFTMFNTGVLSAEDLADIEAVVQQSISSELYAEFVDVLTSAQKLERQTFMQVNPMNNAETCLSMTPRKLTALIPKMYSEGFPLRNLELKSCANSLMLADVIQNIPTEILVWSMLMGLTESTMVVSSSSTKMRSGTLFFLSSALFPHQWAHAFIPVLPASIGKTIIESPVPCMITMNRLPEDLLDMLQREASLIGIVERCQNQDTACLISCSYCGKHDKEVYLGKSVSNTKRACIFHQVDQILRSVLEILSPATIVTPLSWLGQHCDVVASQSGRVRGSTDVSDTNIDLPLDGLVHTATDVNIPEATPRANVVSGVEQPQNENKSSIELQPLGLTIAVPVSQGNNKPLMERVPRINYTTNCCERRGRDLVHSDLTKCNWSLKMGSCEGIYFSINPLSRLEKELGIVIPSQVGFQLAPFYVAHNRPLCPPSPSKQKSWFGKPWASKRPATPSPWVSLLEHDRLPVSDHADYLEDFLDLLWIHRRLLRKMECVNFAINESLDAVEFLRINPLQSLDPNERNGTIPLFLYRITGYLRHYEAKINGFSNRLLEHIGRMNLVKELAQDVLRLANVEECAMDNTDINKIKDIRERMQNEVCKTQKRLNHMLSQASLLYLAIWHYTITWPTRLLGRVFSIWSEDTSFYQFLLDDQSGDNDDVLPEDSDNSPKLTRSSTLPSVMPPTNRGQEYLLRRSSTYTGRISPRGKVSNYMKGGYTSFKVNVITPREIFRSLSSSASSISRVEFTSKTIGDGSRESWRYSPTRTQAKRTWQGKTREKWHQFTRTFLLKRLFLHSVRNQGKRRVFEDVTSLVALDEKNAKICCCSLVTIDEELNKYILAWACKAVLKLDVEDTKTETSIFSAIFGNRSTRKKSVGVINKHKELPRWFSKAQKLSADVLSNNIDISELKLPLIRDERELAEFENHIEKALLELAEVCRNVEALDQQLEEFQNGDNETVLIDSLALIENMLEHTMVQNLTGLTEVTPRTREVGKPVQQREDKVLFKWASMSVALSQLETILVNFHDTQMHQDCVNRK